LVYYREFPRIEWAKAEEIQRRLTAKKLHIINAINPKWEDLSEKIKDSNFSMTIAAVSHISYCDPSFFHDGISSALSSVLHFGPDNDVQAKRFHAEFTEKQRAPFIFSVFSAPLRSLREMK
jgi:hypothetical protein